MKLLNAVDCQGEVHLIIGSVSNIAFQKALKIIEVGATPVLIHDGDVNGSVKTLIDEGSLQLVPNEFVLQDLEEYGREEVDYIVDKVFVIESSIRNDIYNRCKKLRIPINTYKHQSLSTFTLLSAYSKGDLQIGVTTQGQGCNLSSRIKREIVKSLPHDIESIVNHIGCLRRQVIQQDGDEDDHEEVEYTNEMVLESQCHKEDISIRRSRWLIQMIEYYPLAKLGKLSIQDFVDSYKIHKMTNPIKHEKRGSVTLVGSGPGSLSSLTLGALNKIQTADLIIMDKLISQEIQDIIPQGTEVFTCRKFPGNQEAAQVEIFNIAMDAITKGMNVIRLKQGDPYIYGRGGEEFLHFKQHGIQCDVLPGITSALSAPLFAQIPTTHRGVVDQVLICTGTSKNNGIPVVPEYNEKRTTVFLMSIHRIHELSTQLIENNWDCEVPVAVIEKASCQDQRVIRSKLKDIAMVMEELGSRPPGLLVAGWSCKVLKELNSKRYVVEEGIDTEAGEFEDKSLLNMIRKMY